MTARDDYPYGYGIIYEAMADEIARLRSWIAELDSQVQSLRDQKDANSSHYAQEVDYLRRKRRKLDVAKWPAPHES